MPTITIELSEDDLRKLQECAGRQRRPLTVREMAQQLLAGAIWNWFHFGAYHAPLHAKEAE